VFVRFVHHIKALRCESLGQLIADEILDGHGACLRKSWWRVNRGSARGAKNPSVKT
jgi:hypothetical protein